MILFIVENGPVSSFEDNDIKSIWVIRTQRIFQPNIGLKSTLTWIPKNLGQMHSRNHHQILTRIEDELPLEEDSTTFEGWLFLTYIIYDKLCTLIFDPNDWQWGNASSFLSYTSKKGWSFLNAQDNLASPLKSIGTAPSPTILHQIGNLYGINPNSKKKSHFIGLSCTVLLPSMSGVENLFYLWHYIHLLPI